VTYAHRSEPVCSAAQALARLKAGNARFLSGHARFPTVQKEILASLAKGQTPFATILGCSDSRVPPELVFDASFGELFVIRVAGNVLDPAIAGTLQYAGSYLHTPLLVVLGHEGCGAVEAALADHFHGAVHAERVDRLLDNIIPAIASLDPELPPAQLLDQAVEANVRWTLRLITQSPEWEPHARSGDIQAIGAIYDLDTGVVRFLE
jgi:carbonic anhydrase